jgi:hypothetical protein
MPAFDSPVIGWLLRCFLSSAFVIACCHAIVNAFVASYFSRQLASTAATAAAAAAAAALRFWEVVSGVCVDLLTGAKRLRQ